MTDTDETDVTVDRAASWLYRRTWELELLISGAIVVALFQLPGAVDGLFETLEAHISRDLFKIVFSVYYPIKLAITPTLLVFVVHVLLRGFWVGLVGLNAVFPDGIVWDRINLAPITLEFYRARTDPKTLERRLDRAASLLFALLFSLLCVVAALGLWLSAGMILVTVIASLPSTTTPLEEIWAAVYFGILILLAVPGMIAMLIDKSCERWPGLARRMPFLVPLCRGLLHVGGALMLVRLWYPVAATLASNVMKRKPSTWRVVLLTIPGSLLVPLVVITPIVAGVLFDRFDSYIYAPPRGMESGMSSRHYASMRPEGELIDEPTIQSDVISGPYVRLYLPYDAWRDNQRLAELCPEVEPFRRDGDLVAAFRSLPTAAADRKAALACFARLWTVHLNGTEIALDPVFADDPGGRGRGLAAYLPTAGLPEGKNELVVERYTSAEERERRRFNPEKHVFYLPFWR